MSRTTLCIATRITGRGRWEVLLGEKLSGPGTGKIVVIGGHLDPGESPEEAAVRELEEETGLRPSGDVLHVANLTFTFPEQRWDHSTPVFLATGLEGRLRECEEIRPGWYPADALPLHRMWADAAYWLPQALHGIRIKAAVTYTSGSREHVVTARLAPLTDLDEPLSLGAPVPTTPRPAHHSGTGPSTGL
ncbi:8-oxo-dGTP diphosphatase [Streptomyces sp. NPDC004111]|uniref:8-oxo-dGTP diphosphatase n=1 Tax=Streptomyces sp. NPDC004111 TaxID=3364690 RepID=UPI0036BA3AF4